MNFPSNLKYTKDHEWAKVNGNTITVGITDHAQSSLGDIVFVELPKKGRELKAGDTFGVVESIKAVSDLYSPVNGKVIEINEGLTQEPGQVNQDPYGNAWMIRIEVTDTQSVNNLLDAKTYETYVKSLK